MAQSPAPLAAVASAPSPTTHRFSGLFRGNRRNSSHVPGETLSAVHGALNGGDTPPVGRGSIDEGGTQQQQRGRHGTASSGGSALGVAAAVANRLTSASPLALGSNCDSTPSLSNSMELYADRIKDFDKLYNAMRLGEMVKALSDLDKPYSTDALDNIPFVAMNQAQRFSTHENQAWVIGVYARSLGATGSATGSMVITQSLVGYFTLYLGDNGLYIGSSALNMQWVRTMTYVAMKEEAMGAVRAWYMNERADGGCFAGDTRQLHDSVPKDQLHLINLEAWKQFLDTQRKMAVNGETVEAPAGAPAVSGIVLTPTASYSPRPGHKGIRIAMDEAQSPSLASAQLASSSRPSSSEVATAPAAPPVTDEATDVPPDTPPAPAASPRRKITVPMRIVLSPHRERPSILPKTQWMFADPPADE